MTLFRGKIGGLIGFLCIAALVAGGLAWVTREALVMEAERREAANARENEKLQKEHAERWEERVRQITLDRGDKMRSALMLLDSRIMPALAREDSRPYPQYGALHTPFPAVNADGFACEPGQFLIPSPLMTAQLPDWMLLHFQVDQIKGWTSPQVIPDSLQKMLRKQPIELAMNNVDEAHRKLLNELRAEYPMHKLLASLPTFETVNNEMQQSVLDLNINPGNSLNNSVIIGANGQGPANGAQTPAQNTYANNNGDQNDSGKRFQIINRGKLEGLWAYLNDGRNYSNAQGIPAYKALEAKQAEARALEKRMATTQEQAIKDDMRIKIDSLRKEADELRKALQPVEIELTSLQPLWLPSPERPKHLLMVRPTRVGALPAYQGIVLDWQRLQEILKSEIEYLLPDARFIPLAKNDPARLDREMFALPIELDAGPLPEAEPLEPVQYCELQRVNWTPLRVGLALVWVAALVALLAVGLGGWTLLDLSDRRIRFVSAVTHELRTPLTTLRLYLDLLNSGLVSDAAVRDEYIRTLGGEADRLHRLIGNVLDFARLEKTRPIIERQSIAIDELLQHLSKTWNERCSASGKVLEIANSLPDGSMAASDRNLLEQILGNLIDNVRKYSQNAADPRIWLRAMRDGSTLIIEVEDRGPGVNKRERGSIFRPFRRGHDADVKAGGVGLGLALATRWASFIGGRLSVKAGEGGVGACFRLELPDAKIEPE